jgi:hypothetical protein
VTSVLTNHATTTTTTTTTTTVIIIIISQYSDRRLKMEFEANICTVGLKQCKKFYYN